MIKRSPHSECCLYSPGVVTLDARQTHNLVEFGYGKKRTEGAAPDDTFITVEQVYFLVEWVKASGKNLTKIYKASRSLP